MKKFFSKFTRMDFLRLLGVVAISAYVLWQVEDKTVPDIALILLLVLMAVSFSKAAVYLLFRLAKRVALVFGVPLGEWGSDRSINRLIAARRRRLAKIDRGRRPLAYGRAQILLGTAFGVLGQRGADPNALRESAEAFRAALPALREAGKETQWAITQNNLAVTLIALGRSEIGTASLKGAADALRAAAETWEQLGYRSDWGRGQFHLCAVLTCLGRREGGTARLAEAVAAGRSALSTEDNSQVPLADAEFQINLSEALAYLGERERGTERLEEAATMARNALRVVADDEGELLTVKESVRWQTVCRYNLGYALRCLGERRKDPDRLREAEETLRAMPPLNDPVNAFEWAGAHDILADALRLLAEHGAEPDLLTESREASDTALTVLNRETYPFDWAVATMTRAMTLTALGARTGGIAPLRQAVDDLEAALAVFEHASAPFPSRQCRDALDKATALLDDTSRNGRR